MVSRTNSMFTPYAERTNFSIEAMRKISGRFCIELIQVIGHDLLARAFCATAGRTRDP